MMSKKATSHKKPVTVVTIMKTPVRAILKALDLYAKGVTNFFYSSNKPLRTMEVTPQAQQVRRSFSTSTLLDKEQPPESALVRSISTAVAGRKATRTNSELYVVQFNHNQLQSRASTKRVPRSCSAQMGKIDEDKASSFRNDNIVIQFKLFNKDKDSAFSRKA